MKSNIKNLPSCAIISLAVSLLTVAQPDRAAESSGESSDQNQPNLIAVLQSEAPPQEKAIACKKLAIYGDKQAVPALAPLLSDSRLASWARIALEAIPGPEADEALRGALAKLEGKLLIGAINSIGVRRDAKAVEALGGKLKAADLQVVEAAAVALGKIGGTRAAKLLDQALASPRQEVRAAVAEGSVLCAERFLVDGQFSEATQLYDAIRAADVPKQRRLEATRGAILARQSSGIPLLLEELRSRDRGEFGMALRTARELPGPAATEALGAELNRATPERQVMLLLALADRVDAAVLPKVLQVAQTSSKPTRMAALGLLDRFRDMSSVPVLLNAAVEGDAELTRTAKATLTRMDGKAVDAALLDRLPESSGKMRRVLIELAASRRIEGAAPAIVSSAEDSDAGVRKAAFEALSVLGSEQQLGGLVRLLSKSQNPEDRDRIGNALTAICGRIGKRCLPQVFPLAEDNESDLRKIALRALASIGGDQATAVVKAALDDRDESVQDEAVGTLATWPNNWPEDVGVAEPLLALAQSGKKISYQVQGARGYLLYVQENKQLSNGDKLTAVNRLLPFLKQPEQKRLAIATLGAIPTAPALELLLGLAGDPAVAEEACLAIVKVTSGQSLERGLTKELRRKALQTVVERCRTEAIRNKANEALKEIED